MVLSIGVFLRLWAIVMFVLLGAGVSKSCQQSDVLVNTRGPASLEARRLRSKLDLHPRGALDSSPRRIVFFRACSPVLTGAHLMTLLSRTSSSIRLSPMTSSFNDI